jgi:hypothetical protein
MFEDGPVLFISDLVKIIHVKLSDERTEVSMAKINGKNFLLESLNI